MTATITSTRTLDLSHPGPECEVRISDGREYITCQAPAEFVVVLRCETGHARRAWWCQRCFVLDNEYGTWCSACDYEHTVQVDGWWRA